MGIFDVIPILGRILDKIIPDKDAAARAKEELAKVTQKTELDLLIKQVEANAVEARNPNLFVSGWRPAIGWLCVIGVGWNLVAVPILLFLATAFGHPFVPPVVDSQMIYNILFGILGLGMGSLRTYEKLKGVTK